MFFCSRPENPLFPGRSRVMPAPVLPGHPGLHARDQAPDRRTMNENGVAPLQESRPSPVRPAPHGRLHRTFRHGTAYGAQGQIAHLSSGSKQNLQEEGDRPGEERIPKEDTSLPGSRKPCKTAPPDADKGPSCPGPPAGCRKRRGTVPSPLSLLRKRKEGPLSESLHLSDQSGMRITSWIYAHRAVRRAGPCCGSRYGRCRTGA